MRRKLIATSTVLLLLVVGVGAWLATRPSAEERMADFVAELQARGEPLTIAEMESPLPPDGENGADDLARALHWLDGRLGQETKARGETWDLCLVGSWNMRIVQPWHEHATDEDLDELRTFLDSLTPFFDGVARATGKPEIAWPLVEDAGRMYFCGGAARYEAWRTARKLLEAKAIAAGSPDERMDAIAQLLALDRRPRPRSDLDVFVVASWRTRGCLMLRDLTESGRLESQSARAALDGLLAGPGLELMPRVLRSYRIAIIDRFPSLLDGSAQTALRGALRGLNSTITGRPPTLLERAQHRMEDALAGIDFDWRPYIDVARELDALACSATPWDANSDRALSKLEASGGIIASHTVRVIRRAEAAEAIARVALAAAAYRGAEGTWPESPDDLRSLFSTGLPVDPYTGDPFVMERDGESLELRARRPAGPIGPRDETPREAGLVWRLTPQ